MRQQFWTTADLKSVLNNVQLVMVLAALFLCVGCYLSFLWRKRNMFIKSWNYPGPINLPIIGGAYWIMCKPELILDRITTLQQKYPEGLKVWFGNRLLYMINEPRHIEKILGSHDLVGKDFLYKHLEASIGSGLLTASIPTWRRHRKIIAHSFNQKILDSFVQVFAEQALVLNTSFEENCGKDIDIFGLMSRCTLNIICESTMGIQLNIQKSKIDYGNMIDKILSLVFLKIMQIWNHLDIVWKVLGHEQKMKTYLKTFSDLADKVIKDKLESIEAIKNGDPPMEGAPKKRLAILDLIMEKSYFDEIELRDELNILLLAGTDTTAATLSFIFVMLGMFPEKQQKVYEEVIEIMGLERIPEYKDLPHMHYTERFIKETLRIFPTGPFFLRTMTEDVDCGDMIIPKGASAYFGTVFIHRNPKYWVDPLKFDPDRFLPEEIAKIPQGAYIPFSFGPRNCIGMRYAMMNMKTIIATAIRKYRIHSEYKSIEEIEIRANMVLRIRHGAKLSVTPRD